MPRKRTLATKSAKKPKAPSLKSCAPKKVSWGKRQINRASTRRRNFLNRRPHRSFRLTRRRDYKREFIIPGYISFTVQVGRTLWQNRWLFIKFLLVYIILSALLLGVISQGNYSQLADTLKSLGKDISGGGAGLGSQTLALFSAVVSGSLSQSLTQAQQIYAGLLFLVSWLTIVWLLRQRLSGKKVRLRDGIYSSGSPLVSTFLILLVVLVQILPIALGFLVYGAASASGLLSGGVEAMLAWVGIALLAVLSLYWLTSSLIGMVVVTLPGMYPLAALKSSGDLVLGRRLKIMLRLVWLGLSLVILWLIILVPAILLSELVKVAWLPIVPLTVLLLSSFSILWGASYIYLLYRRLIDEPAAST